MKIRKLSLCALVLSCVCFSSAPSFAGMEVELGRAFRELLARDYPEYFSASSDELVSLPRGVVGYRANYRRINQDGVEMSVWIPMSTPLAPDSLPNGQVITELSLSGVAGDFFRFTLRLDDQRFLFLYPVRNGFEVKREPSQLLVGSLLCSELLWAGGQTGKNEGLLHVDLHSAFQRKPSVGAPPRTQGNVIEATAELK